MRKDGNETKGLEKQPMQRAYDMEQVSGEEGSWQDPKQRWWDQPLEGKRDEWGKGKGERILMEIHLYGVGKN